MKYVSVREFRSKVSSYMGELPITLTVYSKPVAVVSKYEVSDEKKKAFGKLKAEPSFRFFRPQPKIKGKKMK